MRSNPQASGRYTPGLLRFHRPTLSFADSTEGAATASTQLARMMAVPRTLKKSGISWKPTTPPMTPITRRRSVYGPSVEALAYFTATIPRYTPTGPNNDTPESQGQTSGPGKLAIARTGRLHATGTTLEYTMMVSSESPRRCEYLLRTNDRPFRLVPNKATR